MDGTIYRGNQALTFAADFIRRLQDDGTPFVLMTNSSYYSSKELSEKLASMRIFVNDKKIVTSGTIAVEYLVEQSCTSAYVIGSPALKELLKSKRIDLDDPNPEYVLIGHDQSFAYQDLALATNYIHAGSRFVCTDMDHAIPYGDGILPHTGAIVAYLQTATGKTPRNTGKPDACFLKFAMKQIDCPPENVCIIGDNLNTDIAMGSIFGVDTALLLSGITNEAELKHSKYTPTYIFRNLGEMMEHRFQQMPSICGKMNNNLRKN